MYQRFGDEFDRVLDPRMGVRWAVWGNTAPLER